MARLRIGSRGSQLALWQANHVAGLLRAHGHQVELEIIKTTGDKMLSASFAQVGTKGMFIKEIEEALSAGRVDLAVHSFKDVPTELAAEFTIAAVMEREDPRDAFVSKQFASLATLPKGARVGTSSLRRQAQLLAARPDLKLLPLRGNVDTRLKKLEAGEYDAMVLAASGLKRLGRTEWLREALAIETMCSAPGQGALAIETRAGDSDTRGHLAFVDHAATRAATACERACLGALGGGCHVPVGALAESSAGGIKLTAVVARPDGKKVIRATGEGSDPKELGERLAAELKRQGADEILRDVSIAEAAIPEQP